MQERDVLDLVLVAVLAVLVYVETYGLADPIATGDEILATATGLDVRVYLVLAGLLGMLFVGYLTFYLPKKDANRSVRR